MLNQLDPGKRLIVYLVINVIVSALTALVVLVIWSNAVLSGGPNIGEPSPATQAALQSDRQVNISAVIGAGDLANERVVLEQVGAEDISLAGWSLRDENGNEYRFPALVLHSGAQLSVYTGQGEDTATALYWGRLVAAWSSGEQAVLYDASGRAQAAYETP
ncbi:MAG: lamin tail domain-containing protein [Anaerolineales bacterium]